MTITARPDSRLLVASTVTTDLSQWDTDLTATGAGAYEDASARTALDGTGTGRAFEVSVELDTGSDGVIICHGADGVGDPAYRIGLAGSVVVFVRGASVVALTPPNLSGTLKTYVLGWSTEPNPDTTGGSDALRSEYYVYDVDGDEMAYDAETHAVTTTSASLAFSIGGEWDGGSLNSAFTDTINAVRISGRFHTRVEGREHLVTQTAAPSNDGIEACEEPVIPEGVCENGALVGPAYQAAARSMAVGVNRHRLVGPLLKMFSPSPVTWQPTLSAVSGMDATRVRTLSDGYQTQLGWLWRVMVPRHAEWLLCKAQWNTWDTGLAAVACNLRVYISDLPPTQANEWKYEAITRSTEDGSGGTGVVQEFDPVQVLRDADGYSWVWLASSIGTNDRFKLRMLMADAFSKPGSGDIPPNQWGP